MKVTNQPTIKRRKNYKKRKGKDIPLDHKQLIGVPSPLVQHETNSKDHARTKGKIAAVMSKKKEKETTRLEISSSSEKLNAIQPSMIRPWFLPHVMVKHLPLGFCDRREHEGCPNL